MSKHEKEGCGGQGQIGEKLMRHRLKIWSSRRAWPLLLHLTQPRCYAIWFAQSNVGSAQTQWQSKSATLAEILPSNRAENEAGHLDRGPRMSDENKKFPWQFRNESSRFIEQESR